MAPAKKLSHHACRAKQNHLFRTKPTCRTAFATLCGLPRLTRPCLVPCNAGTRCLARKGYLQDALFALNKVAQGAALLPALRLCFLAQPVPATLAECALTEK